VRPLSKADRRRWSKILLGLALLAGLCIIAATAGCGEVTVSASPDAGAPLEVGAVATKSDAMGSGAAGASSDVDAGRGDRDRGDADLRGGGGGAGGAPVLPCALVGGAVSALTYGCGGGCATCDAIDRDNVIVSSLAGCTLPGGVLCVMECTGCPR
jgi:hypothetical protein